MFADRLDLTRRRFLSGFAFTAGAIATGAGSWVIRPDWKAAFTPEDWSRAISS